MENTILPISIRIEKARAELERSLSGISEKHLIPPELRGMLVETILSDIRKQEVSAIAELISGVNNEGTNDREVEEHD